MTFKIYAELKLMYVVGDVVGGVDVGDIAVDSVGNASGSVSGTE